MPGFEIFNVKDDDDRWWSFAKQNKLYSCGPASVKIIKEYKHNKKIGEEVIRGLLGLKELNNYEQEKEKGLISAANKTDFIWQGIGTSEKKVLAALKSEPLPIPHARFVQGTHYLKKASRNRPALLGIDWEGGGGHFVVCVGPRKNNDSILVVLDPGFGLKYIYLDPSNINSTVCYNPVWGLNGTLYSEGFIIT